MWPRVQVYQRKQECDIKVGNIMQQKGWVSITKNMIYLSRDKGRSYALFDNCAKYNVRHPKLIFYKTKLALKYGSTLVTFKGDKARDNFNCAKELIGDWAK